MCDRENNIKNQDRTLERKNCEKQPKLKIIIYLKKKSRHEEKDEAVIPESITKEIEKKKPTNSYTIHRSSTIIHNIKQKWDKHRQDRTLEREKRGKKNKQSKRTNIEKKWEHEIYRGKMRL